MLLLFPIMRLMDVLLAMRGSRQLAGWAPNQAWPLRDGADGGRCIEQLVRIAWGWGLLLLLASCCRAFRRLGGVPHTHGDAPGSQPGRTRSAAQMARWGAAWA